MLYNEVITTTMAVPASTSENLIDINTDANTTVTWSPTSPSTQKKPNEQKGLKSSCEATCGCCGIFLGVCCILGIAAGSVMWMILSIIALANKSQDHIKDICPESNLWACLLVLVVISIIGGGGAKGAASGNGDKSSAGVAGLFFMIGFATWAGMILYDDCTMNHFEESTIYLCLYAWFWFVMALFIVIAAALCMAAMFGLAMFGEEDTESNATGGAPVTTLADEDTVVCYKDGEPITITFKEMLGLMSNFMEKKRLKPVLTGTAEGEENV